MIPPLFIKFITKIKHFDLFDWYQVNVLLVSFMCLNDYVFNKFHGTDIQSILEISDFGKENFLQTYVNFSQRVFCSLILRFYKLMIVKTFHGIYVFFIKNFFVFYSYKVVWQYSYAFCFKTQLCTLCCFKLKMNIYFISLQI